MTISRVSIANSALLKLGAERITAMTDDNKRARVCNEQFEKIRDLVLIKHPWNFALKRVTLAKLATTPAWGYSTEYQLPSDFLRVLQMQYSDQVWKVEGQKLLTNEGTANILYICKVELEAEYTALFAEAFALRLAADLAYNLIQNPSLAKGFMDEYKEFIRDARTIDSQEGYPDDMEDDSYIEARV